MRYHRLTSLPCNSHSWGLSSLSLMSLPLQPQELLSCSVFKCKQIPHVWGWFWSGMEFKKASNNKNREERPECEGRLFKSSPNLTSISGFVLERRYKLSLSPSIILYFWLSWVSTEVRLLILMEFDCSVFRYPGTNMHSNWCLRDKTIRQLVKGMIVKRVKIRLKDCE